MKDQQSSRKLRWDHKIGKINDSRYSPSKRRSIDRHFYSRGLCSVNCSYWHYLHPIARLEFTQSDPRHARAFSFNRSTVAFGFAEWATVEFISSTFASLIIRPFSKWITVSLIRSFSGPSESGNRMNFNAVVAAERDWAGSNYAKPLMSPIITTKCAYLAPPKDSSQPSALPTSR